MMIATHPMEIAITPYTSYFLIGGSDHFRRIFTDGRDWPKDIFESYSGYSIGRWIDENGDGQYDVLEVETRGPFKGHRSYDTSGLPLHFDNESIFKERFYLDRSDRNVLHEDVTVIDHALTRPWTVNRRYVREPSPNPDWIEAYCDAGTAFVRIAKELYYLSADGLLMPARKDQPPPDLRYFKQTHK